MNTILISIAVIVCTVCGTRLGMGIRKRLPEEHLSGDTRDIVKLGAGLIATMTALVLGLLVSSAKDTLDTMNSEFTQDGAKIILLDRNLANFGPETNDIRTALRGHVAYTLKLLWGEDIPVNTALHSAEDTHALENIQARLIALAPHGELQSQMKSQALQLSSDLAMSRWLIFESNQRELPKAFLVVLVIWFFVLYTFYGLIAPKIGTTRVVLFFSAISIAGAMFLILEMNSPLGGIVKVSSAPLHKALSLLGK